MVDKSVGKAYPLVCNPAEAVSIPRETDRNVQGRVKGNERESERL